MKEKMTVENFIVGFQNGLWYFTKEKKKVYTYGTRKPFSQPPLFHNLYEVYLWLDTPDVLEV